MATHKRKEIAGGSATASVRRGIAWSAAPAAEDTDTLVLTAPSGKFVDLRYPKPKAIHGSPLRDNPSYWVFSGTAFNSDYANADASSPFAIAMPHVTHTRFVHAIDSRTLPGSGPAEDAGDSVELPTGEHIEWGVMLNPATGISELYKEIWQAAPQSTAAPQKVLRLQVKPGQQARGDALRIGDYFQGVLQRESDGEVVAGRFVRELAEGAAGWAWDSRSTSTAFPASWAADEDPEEHRLGAEVKIEGLVWEVVEVACVVDIPPLSGSTSGKYTM